MSKFSKIVCWIYWISLAVAVLPAIFFGIDSIITPILPGGLLAIDHTSFRVIMAYTWVVFIGVFILDAVLLAITGTISWFYKPRSYFVAITTVVNYFVIIALGISFLLRIFQ